VATIVISKQRNPPHHSKHSTHEEVITMARSSVLKALSPATVARAGSRSDTSDDRRRRRRRRRQRRRRMRRRRNRSRSRSRTN
jgi:hypothetical protein